MSKLKFIIFVALLVLSTAAITAQESDIAITLERTACFGTCPIYTVTIYEDGTVTYSGENFVEVTGEQTGTIDPETVALMVAAFEDAGYFDWDEAYDTRTVSDLPTVITSVTRDGETHQITRYTGDDRAPLALPYLEQWIDIMVNTSLWTGVQSDISTIVHGMDTPLITMQHGACFGFCPVYNVALFEDGTVVYMGIANVDTVGISIVETDPFSVTNIAQRAQIFGYFDWQETYQKQVITDQITVTTTIQWENQYKQIVRYDGDPNAPIGLVRIEESIEELVADFIH